MLTNILKSKNLFIFFSVIFIFLFISSAFLFSAIAMDVDQSSSEYQNPSPFTSSKGDDSACTDKGGTCGYIGVSRCEDGKSFQPGYCLSKKAENYQCCMKTGTKTDTFIVGSDREQTISLINPLGAGSFQDLVSRVVSALLKIGAPILALMIIIGAFQIMSAGGKPENITKGRHTITYAVIGYALLLLSSGIVFIIEEILSKR